MQQNKLIIMLAAILLAVVAVSVGLLYLLPSDNASAPATPTDLPGTSVTGPAPVAGLNVDVLEKQNYKSLDVKPVQDGSLPVQPPIGVGKANPFL